MAAYPKKAIVVGLDGATPDFIERMISEGKLPNFKRFLAEGTLAPHCFSSLPTSTPENWTTISTGAWNGAHQVMSFQRFQPEELKGRWMSGYSSKESKSEFVWDALDRAGKKTILLKYPASWPPTAKNVVQVCGCHVRPCLHQLDGSYLWATVERNGAVPLELKKAEGWRNLPEGGPGPLEATITFGHRGDPDAAGGLSVPACKIPAGGKTYHVLLYAEGDGYDAAAVCRDKDFSSRIAHMKVGQWSEWLVDEFPTEDGPRQGSFRLRLEELSADAGAVRLFCTHVMDIDHYTYPESYGRELFENVGPYICDMGWDAMGHKRSRDWIEPETFVELCDYQHNWMADALRYLTRKEDWALAMMQVHCIDCINHYCMNFAEPALNPDAKEAAYYLGIIEQLYESLDRMVGRIVDDADDETLVVLVSDHGGMADGAKADVAGLLVEAGLAERNEEGALDRARSLAYPNGGNFVNVNLKGRDAEGIVEPGDYEAVRERVISALMEYVEPTTGRHPFSIVLRKEDARILGLWGDATGKKIGDVLIALREGFGGTHGHQLSSAKWGIGSNQNLLAFCGPNIRKGARLDRTAWLVDLVPTVCYLLDLPVPQDCHGSVLHQAFESHPGRGGNR